MKGQCGNVRSVVLIGRQIQQLDILKSINQSVELVNVIISNLCHIAMFISFYFQLVKKK